MLSLTKSELRATLSSAAILSFRMLGLFMILPVFSLYTDKLHGATPSLIGIALGIYGLFQALFQMPLGMLSDRIGRRTVVTAGLLVFAAGSIIAAFSTGIYGIILGRALQGAGAIGSTVIALVADSTRAEHRTKAMAMIGMIIGLSFAAAMILGPLFDTWIHLSGIFWITALLAFLGIIIVWLGIPAPAKITFHSDAEPVPRLFKTILFDKNLLLLNLGICILHAILTASFVVIPIVLSQYLGMPQNRQWYLYLSIVTLAFLLMIPLIVLAEKHGKMRSIFRLTIAMLIAAQFIFLISLHAFIAVVVGLLLFFIAFNFLEASLPSLISKTAPQKNRGTAMGIYSTCQYLGIFIGGFAGGFIYAHINLSAVFIFCAALAIVWLILK